MFKNFVKRPVNSPVLTTNQAFTAIVLSTDSRIAAGLKTTAQDKVRLGPAAARGAREPTNRA
jgi:hypothetical protein